MPRFFPFLYLLWFPFSSESHNLDFSHAEFKVGQASSIYLSINGYSRTGERDIYTHACVPTCLLTISVYDQFLNPCRFQAPIPDWQMCTTATVHFTYIFVVLPLLLFSSLLDQVA